jgi:uncharacterized protein
MRAMKPVFALETATGVVVADHVEVADGIFSRFLGLMFRTSLPEGHGLALRPCSSIHMFFMRIPLDAVFVDGEGQVVRIYADLKPWRMTMPVRNAKSCIELPTGTAARAGLTVGTVVRMVDVAG